jgi:hypothetical protein
MAKVATIKNRRSAATLDLISSAATFGYDTRASFGKAVAAASKLVPSSYLSLLEAKDERAKAYSATIRDFGIQYKAGHLVAYLEPHYQAKRWSNLSLEQRVESAIEILNKANPDADSGNRRSDLEQRGYRAANTAWSHLKDEAGLKKRSESRERRRQPLAPAAGDAKEIPTSNLTVPKFSNGLDAVAFFDRISSDLLNKAVNGNALAVPIGIKSAVQEFRKAIRAAVADSKASAKRARAAKATKGTVSAADIAARTQNPAADSASAK